jgi:type IV pilus assembly protein PilW
MNSIGTCQSKFSRYQYGLSLVELLVALTISLFLIAGVIQLFIGSKQTYRFHESLSRIQENGRFALDALSRDIRMAGHYGCGSRGIPTTGLVFDNTLNTPANFFWNFQQGIEGFESTGAGVWAPVLDASIVSPFAGSDIITVRGPDGPSAEVTAHGGAATNLTVPGGSGFVVGDVVVAANCRAASAFQVTSVNAGPPMVLAHVVTAAAPVGNATANLFTSYLGGQVARVSTKTYYVRTGVGGVPALWRRTGSDPAQELIEGVERMEILYGVCTGVGAARSVNPPYVAANAAGINWANVCSVRINLLLVSLEDNLVSIPQTIIFPADTGNPVVAIDRRLRQSFSATVGIRNRLP